MSSVGVLKKNKVSEEKFSKCGGGKKKNVSVEFRVFEKKKGNWKNGPEKNQSVFFWDENFVKFVFTIWGFFLQV